MTKIRGFFKTNLRIVVLVLFVLELLINIWIVPDQYDAEFFVSQMEEMSLFEFIGNRYQTWTSRLLLEIVTCLVLTKPSIVWILLNTIMTTIIGYAILKIFVQKDDKTLTWMGLCFILTYPIYQVSSSGWGVGTIVYTWPLAMLLFSCISLKKIWNGEKIRKGEYPFYAVALLFACNQEQCCLVALGIYFIFTILMLMRDGKKVNRFLFVQCLIVVLSLGFIMTCPGNYERKNAEIETYYMDFGTLGLFDKISLGLTSTVNQLLVKPNLVFFTFCLVSTVYIFKAYKNIWYRVVSLIPLVCILIFGICKDMVCSVYPYFNVFYEIISCEEPMLTAGNYIQVIHFLPLVLAFSVLGSMGLSILAIFKNLKKNIAIVLYGLGVLSRVAMGFSPTVFASSDRTFIFFEFALIIINILIWQEFLKETDKAPVKARNQLGTVLIILAVLQYFHTMIYTWISQM